MTKTRQISFRVETKLWEDFSIRAIREGKNKTEILMRLIKGYLNK